MSNQYYKAVPQKLTPEDKAFIKLIDNGMKKAPAFREAYPQHPQVIRWKRSEPGSPDHKRAMELIVQAAKNKLQAKYMQSAITTYTESMEKFSDLALDTAIELVQFAESEKVRATLAIEGIRHKIGSPTAKIAVQQEKNVTITFGKPPTKIIEGETVDEDDEARDLDE